MATIIDLVDYIIVLKQELVKKDNVIQALQSQIENINNGKKKQN